MLSQELLETEEAKVVQKLKKELAEAELRLNQKRIEIQNPINKMENISSNMSAKINKIDREMNQRSMRTTISENIYSDNIELKNKADRKRKPGM